LPAAIAGLDLKDGLDRVGGNKKFYKNLLIKLRDGYAAAPDEIVALLEDGRLEEARRAAHSIKGVAGNVGAKKLQETAAALEEALKAGDINQALEALGPFAMDLGDLCLALQELGPAEGPSGSPVAAKKPAAGKRELAAIMEELLPHLAAKKPRPAKEALDKAVALGWPSEMTLDLAELERLVKKYKFKEAFPLAEGLLAKLKA